MTPELRTTHLFTIRLEVAPAMQLLGRTPLGERRIAEVTGGTFEGPRLRGTVMPAGGDWILLRSDGVLQLDVRLTLKTHDDQLIYMTYRGHRHGPADVMERLGRGEPVDPGSYYFRTAPFFETGENAYSWLNGIVAVATGYREPTGPVYAVYEVL